MLSTIFDTDTESEPEEAPLEIEDSQPLVHRAPLIDEEFEAYEPSDTRITTSYSSASVDSTTPLSPDHPLTQASPTPIPTRVSFHRRTTRMARYRFSYGTSSSSSPLALPIRKRYRGTLKLVEDIEDESSNSDTKREGHSSEDEGLGLKYEGPGTKEEEEEEAAPEGQEQAVPVVDTATNEPLGLGYGALRHCELALREGSAPSTFEVGQSSRSVPEHKGAERISVFRQPTLVTWVDPGDGRVYTDILTYVPPVAPVQTPPSLKWSSSSLRVSPSPLVVPSPIASLVPTPVATISIDEDQFLEVRAKLEIYRSILHDHTQHLDALPPTLFKSLEREQERATVTYSAIWRLVLALKACAGQTDAQRAALWHAIYDIQRENHDLRM
ncbi:hypothetical protein Tco_1169246 [Tanacetum coccineum]